MAKDSHQDTAHGKLRTRAGSAWHPKFKRGNRRKIEKAEVNGRKRRKKIGNVEKESLSVRVGIGRFFFT